MATHRSRSLLALAFAVVFLAACSSGAGPKTEVTPRPGFPVTLTDDDGVSVTLNSRPERIVTFAPSNTEVVFALGLGARLVGVSGKYDDYPPAARHITQVGGAGEYGVDPNLEKVVSLRPDLFLTISGGDQWKKRLRDLGIPVFTIDARNFRDLEHDIATVGRLTGATRAATRLTGRMRVRAASIESRVSGVGDVSCFFEEGYGPPIYSVGPGSFIYDLLRRAGCDPVTSGAKTQYPQWSTEALVREDPDVYLVASESSRSLATVGERPGFSALKAVKDHRVVLVNSDLVARPGPRVVQGLRILARALHPEAFG